ncbi:MAG: class I SAM-dependent methyltransferase [Myxococcota bacterium]
MHRRRRRWLLIAACTWLLGAGCRGDGTQSPPETPPATPDPGAAPEPTPKPTPKPTPADASSSYMGRELAKTMSHLGAGWLTRPERDAEENTRAMHGQLGLRPGDVACDLGAGNGYHTERMAAAVGPKGKVIAVDLQPEMIALLRARMAEVGVENFETVLADATDPHLPPDTCDLALLVDVYHELSDPAAVLGHLRRALTKRGRIALLEFRGEDPDVPIKALHKMTKAQILREYEANGLTLVSEYDGLPWQHLMFFAPSP